MKTLYIDCSMGAAGDMLSAALLELLPEPDEFINKLNSLGIPKVHFERHSDVKCGITGTRVSVLVDGEEEEEHHEHHEHTHEHSHEHHEHHHASMHDIEHIVSHMNIPENVKKDVLEVYGLIAEAESHVHGKPVTEIHFHEVGTLDAVADITAVCMLINEIKPDKIAASPVHVGSGQVHCAHGILPVPAPATAYILRDIPIYGGKIEGELCTPTGAALLRHFVSEFGEMPVMATNSVGYGMGKREFPAANCVRAFLGEDLSENTDVVWELSANVDDMTAEEISFAVETLFSAGAREVYTIPIGMKKNRTGTLIRVMCGDNEKEKMLSLIFTNTSTIGIRETRTLRHVLERKEEIFDSSLGKVRRKISSGYGVTKTKWEYDDIAKISREKNIPISEVKKILDKETD